ncbi:MAG: DUF2283 domain-containing protein [Cyanosarcina radialis HA8281-LM2]|nr:DUF2283 domain-containing protein [Cyanosarcina radialis HA8281-LM2]
MLARIKAAIAIEPNFVNDQIAYAEDEGQVILHYSQDDKLVLVEILDFRRSISNETVTALLAS